MSMSELDKEILLVELSNAFTEVIETLAEKEKAQAFLQEIYLNHCKRRKDIKETPEERYKDWAAVVREFLGQINSATETINNYVKWHNSTP